MRSDYSQSAPSHLPPFLSPPPPYVLSPYSRVFIFFMTHWFSPRPCDHGFGTPLESGGLTVGWTTKDPDWALPRIHQTFRGTTKGGSFWSLKNKALIIKNRKCFKITFISTIWESRRDRTKGFSEPRDCHSNTIKCPLRLLQQKGHTVCLPYTPPSPVFSLPFIVCACLKDLPDSHQAQCPSTWLCTRLSCDAAQGFLG